MSIIPQFMAKTGIVCLVGLPGAGKSYAVKKIQLQYYDSDDSIHIVVFDYDALIGVVKSDDKNAWKDARHSVSQMIVDFLDTPEKKLERCSRCTKDSCSSPHILVLDDNFFYSSMRKEVYHICQKYGCVFGEIVFDFGSDICKSRVLSRMKERADPELLSLVTENTIDNMVKLFEFPKELWERNVLWLSDNHNQVPSHIKPVVISPATDTSELINTFLSNFMDLDAEKDPDEAHVLKCEDRTKTLADLKHQGDVCLRKISSEKIKSDRKLGVKCPYSVYSAVKNKVIEQLMSYDKADRFVIDGTVDKDLLYSYLSDKFIEEFLNVP